MYKSPQSREVAVELREVHKSFGANVVHNGVSLQIFDRELIALVGGSGEGKTVLLKEIIGLIPPDSGEIRVHGKELSHSSESEMTDIRRSTGMVFQGSALFDSLDVFSNVAYGLRECHRDMPLDQVRKVVEEKLKLVDLPGIEDMYPAELSGGMKKRVAIARAMALNPRVLLYDEPTTGLDPANVHRIDALIVRLREEAGVTSIMVTHDMEMVRTISDRVALLDKGKILAFGTWDELEKTPDPRVGRFLRGEFEG